MTTKDKHEQQAEEHTTPEIAGPSVQDRQPPEVLMIPLDRLKASPRNARHTPHTAAAVEALAASIEAKGLLQNLVVTPERNSRGQATGRYLVTAGEGRRQALRLLVQRRHVPKDVPVRCLVDEAHDPLELSLDENVTRTAMHPADQFEAFRRLGEEQGWGAEEIAARFGVTPHVVRQRLRLAAVSPRLIQAYRDEELTLEQLVAFTVSDDHARQEQVYDGLGWNREPRVIRHHLLEAHVPPEDRRVRFVGVEAYAAAGGVVVRDLFAEGEGGYCEDAALLDRLALERLEAVALEVRAEGWKWAEVSLDFPHGHGLRRVYPQRVELPAELQERLDGLQAEADGLVERLEGDEPVADDEAARLELLEEQVEAIENQRYVFDAETLGRAGAYVSLGQDALPRIERGFVRADDELSTRPEPGSSDPDGMSAVPAAESSGEPGTSGAEGIDEASASRPLSDALVRDLTAHRTLALRLTLGEQPEVALVALTHALALQAFGRWAEIASCLEIRATSVALGGFADGIEETEAAQALAQRHEAWARQVPADASDLWAYIAVMEPQEQLRLLAHCVALSVNAVQQRSDSHGQSVLAAKRLITAVALDTAAHWRPTVETYLGRVTKERVLEAVREGVSEEAAQQIAGLKKGAMAEAAERLLADAAWLPAPLRNEAAKEEPGRRADAA